MKRISVLFLLVFASSVFAHEGDVAKVGQNAPPFVGFATSGAQVSLESFKGKVVLLDFFATWCGPCMAEMPVIQRDIWEAYNSAGLVVIGIGREHQLKELTDFSKAKQITFTIVADPKREIYKQYATEYIPRCYVIGKDGVVKFATVGYSTKEFSEMKSVIAAELKK